MLFFDLTCQFIQLWRVLRLYGDLSGIRRAGLIGLTVILSLISLSRNSIIFISSSRTRTYAYLVNLVFGFIAVLGALVPTIVFPFDLQYATVITLGSITVLGNVIFATLITVRVYYRQRQISKILGKAYGSPYTRIISICVESCALIAFIYLAFLPCYHLLPRYASSVQQVLMVHASVGLYPCSNI